MNFMKQNLIEREEESIIAHLLKYDEILKKYFNDIRKAQSITSDIQLYSDDINQKIIEAFEDIRTEMDNRLKNLMEYIQESKNTIQNDAIKFRQEIGNLTKENTNLIKQITELKSQIQKMESLIGRSERKQMSFTK